MTEQNEDFRTLHDTNHFLRTLIETKEIVGDKFWIGGFVSRFYKSHLGHTYFALEDEGYTIECMLHNRFEAQALYITKGALLDVYGSLRLYVKKAQIQFQVEDLRLSQAHETAKDPEVLEVLKAQGCTLAHD